MAQFKKRLLDLLAVVVLASPSASFAGAMAGGSTEITQILNNVQLLMQSTTQYMEHATQLEQYYTQLKNLEAAGLGGFKGWVGDAARMYNKAQELNQTVNRFYGSLSSLEKLAEGRYQEFAASGLTWDGYVERVKKMSEARGVARKVLTAQEANTMERVQQNWDRLRQVSAEIPQSEGEHSALQIMNGQMAILNGTMNEMLAFNATQSRAASERTIIEDVRAEKREQANGEMGKHIHDGAKTTRDFLEQLRTEGLK